MDSKKDRRKILKGGAKEKTKLIAVINMVVNFRRHTGYFRYIYGIQKKG